MRTDAELRRLALDIMGGSVFTDRHIRPEDRSLLSSIFLPLSFLRRDQVENMRKHEVTVFFAPMTEAGSRGINGYPSFMTMHTLVRQEAEKLDSYLQELGAFVEGDGEKEEVEETEEQDK